MTYGYQQGTQRSEKGTRIFRQCRHGAGSQRYCPRLVRKDRNEVTAIEVTPDLDKVEEIRKDIEAYEGIFRAKAFALSGRMQPGDDVLYLIVAGDIRENVKAALSDFLDRVKAEAVTKKEIFA